MVSVIPLTFGYIVDLIVGDPVKLPHPVRHIGSLITTFENVLRRSEKYLKVKGLILLASVTSAVYIISFSIVKICSIINPYLGYVVSTIMIFQILATKSLFTETNKVYKALKDGDLPLARKHLSYLVTRDCEEMEEEDIVRSTVETISENIVDGITSPLFYILLGGAPLGMWYKAVNTLDSMVGYKNSKYYDFGFFSAKFDDLVNYIPARVTSIFVVLSSLILRLDCKQALNILIRDKSNHSSPNSGWAEAPVAGALGISLGGKVSYFGKIHDKPTMGNDLRNPEVKDIRDTHKIMIFTSLIFFLICLGVSLWIR